MSALDVILPSELKRSRWALSIAVADPHLAEILLQGHRRISQHSICRSRAG
jgi:hypothetical protein